MINLIFIFLIVIAVFSLLKDLLFKTDPSSHPLKVTCPYCKTKHTFSHDGLWHCPSCHKGYEIKLGLVHKIDHHVTPEIRLMVELFAKVTKSDGVVTKREIRVVDRLIKTHYRPDERQLFKIRELFNEAKQSMVGYESIIQKLHRTLSRNEDERLRVLDDLFQIALADNPLDERQEAILSFATKEFRVSKSFDAIRAKYIPEVSRHYLILECSEHDSLDTIKKNYRRLIKEHHPDRYVHQNASKDFIIMANQKIKEIHHAYEVITQAKKTNQAQ